MNDFEEFLLETLSFYNPLTLTQIILAMDQEWVNQHPTYTIEDLEDQLLILSRKKKIQETIVDGEKAWLRKFHSTRPWWQKIDLPRM